MPARISATVDAAGIRPADRVLEVGGGRGASAAAICSRLAGGGILVSLDRSPATVDAAVLRNADLVETGAAIFVTGSLGDATPQRLGGPFDVVLAVNVNVFWTGPATRELDAVDDLLAPGGALVLGYEPPDGTGLDRLAAVLADHLAAGGFTAEPSVHRHGGGQVLVVRGIRRTRS